MHRLRNECPWDKSQTNESLRTLTIEEVYELSEAILENDYIKIREELGDIILHVVFILLLVKKWNNLIFMMS